MESLQEIQKLRRRLEEEQRLRERAERSQVQAEEQRERAERSQTQAEVQRERAERSQVQAEEQLRHQTQQTRNTTLPEFLDACHVHLFLSLTIQKDKDSSTKGDPANADHKLRPAKIREWTKAGLMNGQS